MLHVVENYEHNVDLNQVINLNETLRKAISDRMLEIKNDNMDLWGIRVNVKIENGKIHRMINKVLEAEHIDLVVMGTHGSTGMDSFEKFMLGSNAYRVVRSAECPVITVRQAQEGVAFKKILLPLDTSKETKDKVTSAIKIARVFGATIHVVSVSSRFDEFMTGKEKLKKQLQEVSEQIEEAGVPVVKKAIRHENVANSVLEYSHEIDADLIIIMTAEENKLAEFALGSSAKKVITESPIPVLSIRPGYK